jgi:hypothetical protein
MASSRSDACLLIEYVFVIHQFPTPMFTTGTS